MKSALNKMLVVADFDLSESGGLDAVESLTPLDLMEPIMKLGLRK
jgi:hypothetical protein